MPVTTPCPNISVLRSLVLGELAENELEQFGEHVLHCDQCVKSMSGMKLDDPLLKTLRGGDTVESLPPVVQSLIAKFSRQPFQQSNGDSQPEFAENVTTPSGNDVTAPKPSSAKHETLEVSKSATDNSIASNVESKSPTAPGELGQLGGYRLLQLLGKGGMGAVFLAEDIQLERQVALKIMRSDLAAKPDSRKRFVREAKATAKLKDDNIVAIYQVGEDNGVPFLTMEYLQGESLESLLRRGEKMPLTQLLNVARDIAQGLAAAHAKGLVHRDIKPANLWLESPRGRVKILDFGLARAGVEEVQITQSGAILGTPAFMAPEQGRGEPADARSDLFSLGCVLYRLCTGRLAFEGANVMAILTELATKEPIPVRKLNPEIPPALEDLVTRLLSKQPEKRPESAKAVLEELQAIESQQNADSKTFELPPSVPNPGGGIDADLDAAPPQPVSKAKRQSTGNDEDRSKAEVAPRLSGRRNKVLIGLCLLTALAGVLYAAGVIRFETPKGTLVIEGANDKDVEVVIKQNGVVIKDKVKAREIELKVGDYTIELAEKGGDLHLKSDSFTITRDNRTPIHVHIEKPITKTAPPSVKENAIAQSIGQQSIPVGQSPFDKLDPAKIPAAERFDWQPKELVGIIGSHRGNVDLQLAIWEPFQFSRDGRWLLRCSAGYLHIWDARSLVLRYTQFPAHGKPTFTPDGNTVGVGGDDETGRHLTDWIDLSGETPKRVHRRYISVGDGVTDLALLPDGKSVVTGGSNGHLWINDLERSDQAPRKVLREMTSSGQARSYNIMVSPDGKKVGAICMEPHEIRPFEGAIRFWEVGEGKPKELFSIPFKNGGLTAALSPDGKTLFLASANDGWLDAYDLTGEKPMLLDHVAAPPNSAGCGLAGFLEDHSTLRVFRDGIELWELRDGKLKKRRDLPKGALAASDDLSRLIIADDLHFNVFAMNLCDITGKILVKGEHAVAFGFIGACPFVAGERVYTTTSPYQSWEVKNGAWSIAQESERDPYRRRFVISPDEHNLAASIHQAIAILPVQGLFWQKQEQIQKVPSNGWSEYCWGFDHKTLFVAQENGRIEAWDVSQNPPTQRLIWKDGGRAIALAASADNRHLAWIDHQRKLTVFNVDGNDQPIEIPSPEAGVGFLQMQFAPSGPEIFATTSNATKLFRFSVDQPSAPPAVALESTESARIWRFELSRDGKLLATTNKATIRWFDATAKPMRELGEWKQFAANSYFQIAPDSRHILLEQAGMIYVLRSGAESGAVSATPTRAPPSGSSSWKPLDPAWVKAVAAMPARQQVEAVTAELVKRNPGFDGEVTPIIEGGDVTNVEFLTLKVKDISPLLAFPKLESISCHGYAYNPIAVGQLIDLGSLAESRLTAVTISFNKAWDLEPLKRLKLTYFDCYWTSVSDLSAIRDMKLTWLNCGNTKVSDLSPIQGMPLKTLLLNSTSVSSLAPVKGMSLRIFCCRWSQIKDLSPLAGMPLEEIQINPPSEPDAEMLRAMPTLKKINNKAAADFWKEYDATKENYPKK